LFAHALPTEVRGIYRYHWAYSVLSGSTAGILTNAPTIGIKVLGAADWHLAMPTGLTGFGLIQALVLGAWMSSRSKMPFVLLPGVLSCAASLCMAAALEPFWFLFLLGVCNLFETITRPAITAIIRASYPPEIRGAVTGKLRQWSVGTFTLAAYATASLLDWHGTWRMVQVVLVAATALQALAYIAFSRIRISADGDETRDQPEESATAQLQARISIVWQDSRFLRYLAGCFVFGVSALLYDPVIRAFFSKDLGLNYIQCAVLTDVLPSLLSLLTVHQLGSWFDRTNPLVAWAWIRVAWGLDPLLLALVPSWPAGGVAIAAAARSIRGSVMNGSWILGWQLGTNYFASRRDLTSVYMGAYMSVVGVQRIVGPPLGAFLVGYMARRDVLFIGGIMVLVSSAHAWLQARAERIDGRDPTFAERERLDFRIGQ
jgi:hypothetical protein